jgi:predicted flap endonuclease-1-like 5' DNA nuclease
MHTIRILEEGSTSGEIGMYVWVALIIFFLMVFLGWLVASKGWLKKQDEPVAVDHGHDLPEEEHLQDAGTRSAVLSMKDDLTTLEGIGPKVAGVLAGLGVTTFDELAKADYDSLKAALVSAGYQYMDPSGWKDQAVLAAKGDFDGLKKLQDSLKGGRKAG